jgi:hypothetical protein
MPVVPKDEVPGSGLFCFKDQQRACTAECMAYVNPPPGEDYKDQQWAHCLELVNLHRVGKHTALLAAQAGEIVKIMRTPSPPVPR